MKSYKKIIEILVQAREEARPEKIWLKQILGTMKATKGRTLISFNLIQWVRFFGKTMLLPAGVAVILLLVSGPNFVRQADRLVLEINQALAVEENYLPEEQEYLLDSLRAETNLDSLDELYEYNDYL